MRPEDALKLNVGELQRELDLGRSPLAISFLPQKDRNRNIGERITFLGADGIEILKQYLDWRKRNSETITAESPLFVGRSKRYNGKSVKGLTKHKFEPDEIFHLARNRVADEIHGVSMVKAVEEIILMRNEAMADYKKLLHRNIYPVRIWHLDTDDTAKIAAFKAKADKAYTQGENIYIPQGTVETEIAAVPTNATLNPLPWITQLNQYFFQATGVPQIIAGGSMEITEASAKIAYLAFEQTIEEEQLYLEEQVLRQLNLEIELEFPASLQNEMLSDTGKSETMQASTPEDTTAEPQEVTPAPEASK